MVGSHLAYKLLKEGKRVRAIVRASSNQKSILKVISYYEQEPNVLFDKLEFVVAELTDVPELYNAIKGTEVLYHCAATVSFSPKSQKQVLEINPLITANVVNIALETSVNKLVYVSSVASLGRKKNQQDFDERSEWIDSNRNSNYSIGKYKAELEVWRGIQEGLNAVMVNPAIILGPGFWHSGSSALFHNVAKGFKFYSKGVNAYVDVRDVVEIMLELRDRDISEERFVLAAENISYEDLFKKIAKSLGVKAPNILVKPWMAALFWRLEKIRSWFGANPMVTRETANTAQQKYYYHSNKVKNRLNYSFRSLDDTIKDLAGFYKADFKS